MRVFFLIAVAGILFPSPFRNPLWPWAVTPESTVYRPIQPPAYLLNMLPPTGNDNIIPAPRPGESFRQRLTPLKISTPPMPPPAVNRPVAPLPILVGPNPSAFPRQANPPRFRVR